MAGQLIYIGDKLYSNGDRVAVSQGDEDISPFTMRNKLINGGFDIWQRGTSFTGSGYTADRWYANDVTSVEKTYMATASEHGASSLTINFGPSAFSFLEQRIENGAENMGGRTFTCKIQWGRITSTTHDLLLVLLNEDGSIYSDEIELNPVAWGSEVHSLTLPSLAADASGTYTRFRIYSVGSTNGSYGITSIQLEEGLVATPFEQRPIGMELALCQRYYEVITSYLAGIAFVPELLFFHGSFKVTKRVNPSMASIANGSYMGNGLWVPITDGGDFVPTIDGYRVDHSSYSIEPVKGYAYSLVDHSHSADAEL